MSFRVDMLGDFVIRCDGRPIKLPRKGRGLLAYLAVAAADGRGVSRERIATVLWPYQQTEQARHSLRNMLLAMHQGLGEFYREVLVTDSHECRYLGQSDVADFSANAHSDSITAIQTAAALYRGDFLGDIHIESDPWIEWVDGERDRWRTNASDLFMRISRMSTATAHHETAIAAARKCLALDSFNEVALRLLMKTLAAAGRTNEALRQYELSRKELSRELRVEPERDTQALRARIAAVQRRIDPEVQRLDRNVLAEILVRLERFITTRHVAMQELKEMRDEIKQCLGDEPLFPKPSPQPQPH